MRKLNSSELKQKEVLAQKLDTSRENLESVLANYNKSIAELWASIGEAVQSYNEVREEVNEFCGGIVDDIENYVGDRSESWQESEAAGAYEDWKNSWDEEIDELQLDEPDEIEIPEEAYGGQFLRDKEDAPNL